MKLFIDAGHSVTPGKDRGAYGNGRYEGVEVAKFRSSLVKELATRGIKAETDPDDLDTKQTLSLLRGKTSPSTILISYHFNSFNATSTGVETFVDNNPILKELTLASKLSMCTHRIMNIPLRGAFRSYSGVKNESSSQHTGLGWMRLPGINVLHEFCFISNKNELANWDKNYDALVKGHADVIEEFYKANFDYSDELTSPSRRYTVKSGDSLSKIAKEQGTTVAHIKEINHLESDLIKVGQVLIVN